MNVDKCERKKVCAEWDMAWFCDKCGKMIHWKTKAYVVNGKYYCRDCAENLLTKNK